MLSALKCLLMPVERVAFNAVLNLLHLSHVHPAALPRPVLDYLVSVSAVSRYQRISPWAKRVRAVHGADFAVDQLVRWLDVLVLPNTPAPDPWFVTQFSEHIGPAARKALSDARVNRTVNGG